MKLFNERLVERKRSFKILKAGSSYRLAAGSLRGVGKGDRFSVYSDFLLSELGGDALGEVVMDAAYTFFSSVSPIGRFAESIPDRGAIAVYIKLRAHDTPAR